MSSNDQREEAATGVADDDTASTGESSLLRFLVAIMSHEDEESELPDDWISHVRPAFCHPPVKVPPDPALSSSHAPSHELHLKTKSAHSPANITRDTTLSFSHALSHDHTAPVRKKGMGYAPVNVPPDSALSSSHAPSHELHLEKNSTPSPANIPRDPTLSSSHALSHELPVSASGMAYAPVNVLRDEPSLWIFSQTPVIVPRGPTLSSFHAPSPGVNKHHHLMAPKIQVVPRILRDDLLLSPCSSQECYEPLVVSLGPYHRGNTGLLPMDKIKRSMLRRFVMGGGGDPMYKKCEQVCRTFREIVLETDVKQRYVVKRSTDENFEDEILFATLLVDVCFIIQFIHSCVDERQLVTEMKIHEFAWVLRDLFLLENQVPFPVIKAMMKLKFSQEEIFKMIDKFIDKVLRATRTQQESFSDPRKYRREPIHLLDALHMRLVDPEKLKRTRDESQEDVWYSYRSVMELKAAGVRFRPGRSSCFTDISFEANLITGTLTIPPIRIDDSTKTMLLNLVAFEMLPDAPDTLGVTSYLCLMDSLIDSAEDVKELRSSGILANFLGSDQQVADLFNEIAKNLVRNPHAYAQITSAIERHYKNTTKIWMSEWLHTHFSTPWTVIAFLFVILGIALSITQTYFAIFPRNG